MPPPAEVCDFVLICAKLLPCASICTNPLSPRIVSVPVARRDRVRPHPAQDRVVAVARGDLVITTRRRQRVRRLEAQRQPRPRRAQRHVGDRTVVAQHDVVARRAPTLDRVRPPSPPSTIFVPSPAVIVSLPPRSVVPPPAEVCDFVPICANLLPTASICTNPLSPRIVSVPLTVAMTSAPMPPRIVLFPLPVLIRSLPPVADSVSVVSKRSGNPAPVKPSAT